MSALASAALAHAQRGWPVFPLRPRHKEPQIPSAHAKDDPLRRVCQGDCGHEGHGLYDATTDAEVVERWWSTWPTANVGLRTGVAFDVVDVDGPAGRLALIDYMAEHDLRLPGGPWAWTPGKADGEGGFADGDHLYVLPSGLPNRAKVLGHIDYRGAGGYVVAAPSVHPDSGREYEWETCEGRCGGPETPLEPLPVWLVDLFSGGLAPGSQTVPLTPSRQPGAYGERALEGELGRLVRHAGTKGGRNDQLNRSAFALGQLVGEGHLDVHRVFDELLRVALAIGLSEAEASDTINSGLAGGVAKQRRRRVA